SLFFFLNLDLQSYMSNRGAYFSLALCQVLNANSDLDLLSLLTIVNKVVAARSFDIAFKGTFKQMPFIKSTLRFCIRFEKGQASVQSHHAKVIKYQLTVKLYLFQTFLLIFL